MKALHNVILTLIITAVGALEAPACKGLSYRPSESGHGDGNHEQYQGSSASTELSYQPKESNDGISNAHTDADYTIKLYDADDGNVCLEAHFNMEIKLHGQQKLECVPVNTSHYEGRCDGDPGPLLAFKWNNTASQGQVYLMWNVGTEETVLDQVNISLTLRNETPIYVNRTGLKMFPTPNGCPAVFENDCLKFESGPGEQAMVLDFKQGEVLIDPAVVVGLSIVAFVGLAIVLAVMIATGAMFYYRGSRENKNNKMGHPKASKC